MDTRVTQGRGGGIQGGATAFPPRRNSNVMFFAPPQKPSARKPSRSSLLEGFRVCEAYVERAYSATFDCARAASATRPPNPQEAR